MSPKGDEGCVVKSSHRDVKQAHAEAPSTSRSKGNEIVIFVSLSPPLQRPPSRPSRLLPDLLMLFFRLSAYGMSEIYMADQNFGSVSRSDTVSLIQRAAESLV